MRFFPTYTFYAVTDKKIDRAYEILKENTFISRLKLSRAGDMEHGKVFTGEVSEEGFVLKQCQDGYNMFIPLISGKIKEQNGTANLDITLSLFRMAKHVVKNLIVYSSFFVLLVLAVSIAFFTFSFAFTILLILPASIYAMMVFGFLFFTKKLKQRLVLLFGASTKIVG